MPHPPYPPVMDSLSKPQRPTPPPGFPGIAAPPNFQQPPPGFNSPMRAPAPQSTTPPSTNPPPGFGSQAPPGYDSSSRFGSPAPPAYQQSSGAGAGVMPGLEATTQAPEKGAHEGSGEVTPSGSGSGSGSGRRGPGGSGNLGMPPPQPQQLPPQMFTTAAQLLDLTDKKLMVALRDGRKLIGVLRSWDQFANLVLQSTSERLFTSSPPYEYCDIPRGTFLVRGENVLLLGEIDLDKDDEPPKGFEKGSETNVHKRWMEDRKRSEGAEKRRTKVLKECGFVGEEGVENVL